MYCATLCITFIFKHFERKISYIEWNQAYICNFVDVSPVHLADLLRVFNHTQIVLSNNVHCAKKPKYGPIIYAHLLI